MKLIRPFVLVYCLFSFDSYRVVSSSMEVEKEATISGGGNKQRSTRLRGTNTPVDRDSILSNSVVERGELSIPPKSTCLDSQINWHDSGGPKYNCVWYATNPSACSLFGHKFAKDGLTANQVCCTCGGGQTSGTGGNGFFSGGASVSIFTNNYNGDCMSVNSGDDNNIVIWDCTIGNYQKWKFQGNTLKNAKSGNDMCLNWNQSNDDITMKPCNGGVNQNWYEQYTNDGVTLRVSDPNKGKCLALKLTGTYTNVKAEVCNSSLNQKFWEIIAD